MEHKLFSPLTLKNITLPGRAVRSATELFCSYPDAHVHPYEFEVYRELADSSLGMIITAHTCVAPEGRSNLYQNAIWSDEYLEESKKIASLASANGTPIILQLGHGGMKAEGNNNGLRVYTPDNMSETEISGVVKSFGTAAKRAMQAGFSGGSAENRFRIIREIYEEIKTVCGDSIPVFMKINGDDRKNTEEYHNDILTVLHLCEHLNMDAVEISGWDSARRGIPGKPYFIDNISRLHTETEIPLIAVGGIRTLSDIDALFDAGACAVSMARPLLQDPKILSKLSEGKESGCTGCCFCFSPLKLDTERIVRCPHKKDI